MSPKAAAPVDAMLKPYVGMRIFGGCEDCDAYQEVHQDPAHPEIWHITVTHDDSCATYRAHLERELKQLRAAWKANQHDTQRREEIRARGDRIRQQLAKGSR